MRYMVTYLHNTSCFLIAEGYASLQYSLQSPNIWYPTGPTSSLPFLTCIYHIISYLHSLQLVTAVKHFYQTKLIVTRGTIDKWQALSCNLKYRRYLQHLFILRLSARLSVCWSPEYCYQLL